MIFETNKTTALSDVAISGDHEDLTNIPVKRIWFGEGLYDQGMIKVTSDDGNFRFDHLNQIIVSFGNNVYFTSGISSAEFNIAIDDYDGISIANWDPDIINNVVTFTYDKNLQVFIPDSWSVATSEKFGQVKLSDDYINNNDNYTALSTMGLQSFKDSLPTVATTGNYSDLLNKPDFNTSFTDAFNNLTISTIHSSAVNYHTKSNTIANALNELYNKSVVLKTFSPYTNYSSSNTVTIHLYRRGYIVHCGISGISHFPQSSSAFNEYTIPELFRPAFEIHIPCICTSSGANVGTMRWVIGTNGSISFDSNTATVWAERYVNTTWVTNNPYSL